MRRKDRELDSEQALTILDEAEYGVLSIADTNGIPYGVPLNFVRKEKTILIHCAAEGRKLDFLRQQRRVSFCATQNVEICSEKFTSHYKSVIVAGTVHFIEDENEKRTVLFLLCEKYHADDSTAVNIAIDAHLNYTSVIRIEIENITGKANP